jgi:hypothetical protein
MVSLPPNELEKLQAELTAVLRKFTGK